MLNDKTIAVVVPCYNEEHQVEKVITSIPDFVDRIIIVNDGSKDNTENVVKKIINSEQNRKIYLKKSSVQVQYKDDIYAQALEVEKYLAEQEKKFFVPYKIYNDNDFDRTVLITQTNSGVGAAIATGYKWCLDCNINCTAVMAGDGQMDPDELITIISPVIYDNIDYVKGNRLIHKSAKIIIPKIRFFGNSVLSMLTKIASGYWNISDTQTGYTAISLEALQSIALYNIYPSYGCPNDILVKLNMSYCSIREVPIKPIYNIGEQSKMKITQVVPKISWLLMKSFFKRICFKYVLRDFHPLALFYLAGFLSGIFNFPVFIYIFINVIVNMGSVSQGYYIIFVLLAIFSFQSIGLAMWMDIQNNEKLYK